MLTFRAVLFAIAVAVLLAWILREVDAVWTWPLAVLIVLAAWWVFGQRQPQKPTGHKSSDILGGF